MRVPFRGSELRRPGEEEGLGSGGAEEVLSDLLSLRASLRRAQKSQLLLALSCLLSLSALLLSLVLRPAPVYFGMSQDMRLLPMTPLSEPVMNEPALKSWVAQALSASLHLVHLQWR